MNDLMTCQAYNVCQREFEMLRITHEKLEKQLDHVTDIVNSHGIEIGRLQTKLSVYAGLGGFLGGLLITLLTRFL